MILTSAALATVTLAGEEMLPIDFCRRGLSRRRTKVDERHSKSVPRFAQHLVMKADDVYDVHGAHARCDERSSPVNAPAFKALVRALLIARADFLARKQSSRHVFAPTADLSDGHVALELGIRFLIDVTRRWFDTGWIH